MVKKTQLNLEEYREYNYEVLKKEIPLLTPEQLKELETISYNSTEGIGEYTRLIVKVISNLQKDYVINNLNEGTWTLEEFVKLERETLNPEKWQKLQEERLPKNTKKERVKGTNKCPRCKSWYTTYKQAQTRSGDEGLTTRCHCEDCDYHWKFG